MKNVLVFGGTSGLGLELAKQLAVDNKVWLAGRHDPEIPNCKYLEWSVGSAANPNGKWSLRSSNIDQVDVLIYAAGFYQEGLLWQLEVPHIQQMLDIGLNAPVKILHDILSNQKKLDLFIPITSTSQWTPRKLEPVYTAVKAGLGHFANSMSLDEKISKTLLVGPSGMKTPFWSATTKDTSEMLDTSWVADRILENLQDSYKYRFIKVHRAPPRVEIVETRN